MKPQRRVLRAAPVGALVKVTRPGARQEYQIWAVDLERCPVCGDGPRSTTTRVAYADCAGDSSSAPHAAPVDIDCLTCPVSPLLPPLHWSVWVCAVALFLFVSILLGRCFSS